MIIGSKAKQLVYLKKKGFNIPEFFLINPGNDIRFEIEQNIPKINNNLVAVRTSAGDEDKLDTSNAGRYVTCIGVSKNVNEIYDACMKCYAVDINITIIVQSQVRSDVSGVIFTRDPLSGSDRMILSIVHGQCTALVSGLVTPQTYSFDKHDKTITCLNKRITGMKVDVENRQTNYTYDKETDYQLLNRIVNVSAEIEDIYENDPQDIEFSIENDIIYILQSRPVSTLPNHHFFLSKQSPFIIDDSNIRENFNICVSPLTYSIFAYMYRYLYYSFLNDIGVTKNTVKLQTKLENMLYYHEGRVMYNLSNWYYLLCLLPLIKDKDKAFEQMLGCNHSLDNHRFPKTSIISRMKMFSKFFFINRKVGKFLKVFWGKVDKYVYEDVNQMTILQLLESMYDVIDLYTADTTSILNDVWVMVTNGVLKNKCQKYSLNISDILTGFSTETTDATKLIDKISCQLAESNWWKSLDNRMITKNWLISQDNSILKDCDCTETLHLIRKYWVRYSHRSMNEQILEESTSFDDIDQLFRLFTNSSNVQQSNRINQSLPVQVQVLKRFAVNAIQNREKMRYCRSITSALVKIRIRRVAKSLCQQNLLLNENDIYMLTFEELKDIVHGSAFIKDVRSLILERQSDYGKNCRRPHREHRFQMYAPTFMYKKYPSLISAQVDKTASRYLICSPGFVENGIIIKCKTVDDFIGLDEKRSYILVVDFLDVSWLPHLKQISGVITGFGGLLSHTSIMMREYGIPMMSGVDVSTFENGQIVTLDCNKAEIICSK